MPADDRVRFERKVNHLRHVIVAGFCWFFFVIVVPDFISGMARYSNPKMHAILDAMSMVVLGSATVYLMVQIWSLTKVILPVLIGVALLLISQAFRILGTMALTEQWVPTGWFHLFYHLVIEAFNGMGMVLFVAGLFYAIVELIAARHAAETAHEQLSREMAERQRAERAVAEQRMRTVAASRLSSLGTMASGVAHEINNPLAVISGTCQQLEALVARGDMDTDRATRLTSVLARNVGRIERIVRGLRRLSRDGEREPFVAVPVKTLVEDTLELCRQRFKIHGIALTVPEVREDLMIECRPTLAAQVLLNLLNNAFDASESASEKWVRLEILEGQNSVDLRVIDSGVGIPNDQREQVFDPFYTTKTAGQGVGIGLSISRSIMQAHDGDLLLDATNPNTCFVAKFPRNHPLREYAVP